YNGLKLFDSHGRVISAAAGQRVIDRFRRGDPRWRMFDELGVCEPVENTVSAHRDLVLARCNVDRISQRKFRVLIDANHGAGSVLAKPLLAALGCETTILGDRPDGMFAHPPEPTAEN